LFPGESWLWLLGIVPLVGALIGIALELRGHRQAVGWTLVATGTVFATSLFGVALTLVDRHQQNHVLLSEIERRGGIPQIGAFGGLEPTWIFYGQRPVQELSLRAEDRSLEPDSPWKLRPRIAAHQFFADGQNRYIITTAGVWPQLQRALPDNAQVIAECPLFLKKERLLLIGAADAPPNPDAIYRVARPKAPDGKDNPGLR
jgi:hypothetical protein